MPSSVRTWPRMVAPLTASMSGMPPNVIAKPSRKPGAAPENGGRGSSQSVISTGNDTSRATRASIAGLKRFWPIPPNTCLPTTMAKKPPMAPIHHGAHGGSDKASKTPVSRAEPSSKNGRTARPASRRQTASPSRHVNIVTKNRFSAGQPNSTMPYSVAGATANSTRPMMRGTLSDA